MTPFVRFQVHLQRFQFDEPFGTNVALERVKSLMFFAHVPSKSSLVDVGRRAAIALERLLAGVLQYVGV